MTVWYSSMIPSKQQQEVPEKRVLLVIGFSCEFAGTGH